MKSVEEINKFLDNVDCGEPVYSVRKGYGDISLSLDDWAYKTELGNSDHWLVRASATELRRKFSVSENKNILLDRDRAFRNICRHVRSAVVNAARETSPAEQPKRTKAYKGIVEISHSHENDESFINDVLPVLNYYFSSKTDENESMNMKVHRNNTFALLEILRKKHGKSNS